MLSCQAEEVRTPAERVKSRDELILEHLPQVKLIAKRISKGLPPSVALDDLISAGILGLIAAIDRYDDTHDVKLRTYAEYKIRGAILDSLRVLDWAPRQQRKRTRLMDTAITALEQQKGRAPEEDELAEELGISIDELQDWQTETHALTINRLETGSQEEDSRDLMAILADAQEQWPSEVFERAELTKVLAAAVAKMPRLEKQVVQLHFYEGFTLRDIAGKIGLHESRVSQLKGQATARLRTQLRNSWPTAHGSGVSPALKMAHAR